MLGLYIEQKRLEFQYKPELCSNTIFTKATLVDKGATQHSSSIGPCIGSGDKSSRIFGRGSSERAGALVHFSNRIGSEKAANSKRFLNFFRNLKMHLIYVLYALSAVVDEGVKPLARQMAAALAERERDKTDAVSAGHHPRLATQW